MDLLVAALFLSCLIGIKGSIISLTRNPDVIKPILTQTLTLRCSLNDSVQTSTSGGLVGKRDVTSTSGNVQALVSLVVLRNGVDLASISSYAPGVKVLGDVGSLNATGHVSGSGGLLELTWVYPGEEQSGNYSCEANGISDVGHPVRFLTSLQMPVHNPGLVDLIGYIHDQQIQIHDVQTKNTNLTQTVLSQGQLIQSQGQHMQSQDQLIKSQDMKMDSMQKQQDAMQHLLNRTRHIENGTYDCGESAGHGSWSTEGRSRVSHNITVTFDDGYDKSPVVLMTVTGYRYRNMGSSSRYQYTEYYLDLLNVGKDSFTYRCRVPIDSTTATFKLYNMKVSWYSFSR